MADLFTELKRRNVFKVAIVYAVVGWLTLQIADVLLENFGVPDWGFKFVAILLLLGFPISLIFAWAFEMTPEGIKREKDVDRSRSITKETGHKLNYTIIGLLVVGIAYFAIDKFVLRDGGPEPDGTGQASIASIAVLPFVDMSPDKDQEYFSDGISEELLNLLAQIRDFRVAGRTSSFSFKGKDQDLRIIGEKLNVDHILEGSVRKAGNQLRITAQLVKVDDGYHVWSAAYDRELDNVFEIQDEIATAVVTALKETLLGEDIEIITEHRPTDNPEAYAHYMKGRHHMHKRTPQDFDRALEEYQRAVSLDPDFALAYSGMADTYVLMVSWAGRNPQEIAFPAQAAVDKAMALNPDLAEVQTSMGGFLSTMNRDPEALAYYERAVELNPNYAQAWAWMAQSLPWGDDRWLPYLEKAYQLEPLSRILIAGLVFAVGIMEQDQERIARLLRELEEVAPDWVGTYTSGAAQAAMRGDLADNVRWLQRGLEVAEFNQLFEDLAAAQINMEDYDAAAETLERARVLFPNDWDINEETAWLMVAQDDTAGAHALMQNLVSRFPDTPGVIVDAAEVAIHAGEHDVAYELLLKLFGVENPLDAKWNVENGPLVFAAEEMIWLLRERHGAETARALYQATLDIWNADPAAVSWNHLRRGAYHAAMGENELAIAEYQRALEMGAYGVWRLERSPILAELREDPRFLDIIEQMHAKRMAAREELEAETRAALDQASTDSI